MQRAVILTRDEHRAIPANAGSLIFDELLKSGMTIIQPDGTALKNTREWLIGTLSAESELLTVPWMVSTLNPNAAQVMS